jgi:hypothetical protein
MRRAAASPISLSLPLLIALAVPAAGAAPDAQPRPLAPAGAWALAEPLPGFGEETAAPVSAPAMGSALTSASAMVDDGALLAVRGMGQRPQKPKKEKPADAEKSARPRHLGRLSHSLSGQRARLMLQSLTMPGWGQATLGERRATLAFGLLEAGVWSAFSAFRIQQQMRQQTYERTAQLFAGIDLRARDEEYRRIVGFYLSSDEYNRLVVRRDAANLYFGDPAAYDAYIAEHELKGDDAWAWDSESSLLRYRAERQSTQRAIKHAHDALAAAVINRLLSMIHASAGGLRKDATQTSWKVECVPADGDPTAFHLGLRADF